MPTREETYTTAANRLLTNKNIKYGEAMVFKGKQYKELFDPNTRKDSEKDPSVKLLSQTFSADPKDKRLNELKNPNDAILIINKITGSKTVMFEIAHKMPPQVGGECEYTSFCLLIPNTSENIEKTLTQHPEILVKTYELADIKEKSISNFNLNVINTASPIEISVAIQESEPQQETQQPKRRLTGQDIRNYLMSDQISEGIFGDFNNIESSLVYPDSDDCERDRTGGYQLKFAKGPHRELIKFFYSKTGGSKQTAEFFGFDRRSDDQLREVDGSYPGYYPFELGIAYSRHEAGTMFIAIYYDPGFPRALNRSGYLLFVTDKDIAEHLIRSPAIIAHLFPTKYPSFDRSKRVLDPTKGGSFSSTPSDKKYEFFVRKPIKEMQFPDNAPSVVVATPERELTDEEVFDYLMNSPEVSHGVSGEFSGGYSFVNKTLSGPNVAEIKGEYMIWDPLLKDPSIPFIPDGGIENIDNFKDYFDADLMVIGMGNDNTILQMVFRDHANQRGYSGYNTQYDLFIPRKDIVDYLIKSRRNAQIIARVFERKFPDYDRSKDKIVRGPTGKEEPAKKEYTIQITRMINSESKAKTEKSKTQPTQPVTSEKKWFQFWKRN